MQDGFYKDYPIAADVAGALIVAFTGSGLAVALAANAQAAVAGVTDTVGGQAAHGLVSVQQTQETDVRYGAAVAIGDPLMAAADGSGRAVPLVKPGSGVRAYCIGFARRDGLAGDIGKALLAPHVVIG